MTGVDHLVRTTREQADFCQALGSPLYAALLRRCADDIDAGGPTARVLAGHEDDPGSAATPLRLLGSVHRLVLQGEAPALAAYYPSAGGQAEPDGAWLAFRNVLDQQAERLAPLLGQPPQTNEVGRASALAGGLLHLVRERDLPVALHEIGSSAGLNLRADAFWYSAADGTTAWGPPDSPVRLPGAWAGATPPLEAALRIVSRSGSDVAPIDPTSDEGRLRLLSYVWPDQIERFERVQHAIEVARRIPATVEACDAATAVRRLEPVRGQWTVLWHSVMWQYLASDDQAAITQHIESVGATATAAAPLAHLSLEPRRREPDEEPTFLVALQTWPGGAQRILGTGAAHGIPTTWEL